jgi:hypothetical protein
MKTFRIFTSLLLLAMLLMAVAPAKAQAGLPPLCSGVQLQNATSTAADNVSMNFYAVTNSTGNADYVYTVTGGLAANASKSFYIPSTLPSSVPDAIYSVVVNSSQQLNSLVNEVTCAGSTPYVVASHSGVQASQVGSPVYLGYILSRAFGASWSSVIAIQNAGTAAATDTKIEFFAPGSSTAVETFTTPTPIQPGVTWYLDLSTGTYASTALNKFAGAAKITSSQPVAAVANYAPAAGDRLLSYNGVTSASTKLYATQITKHAFASDFTSGITLYNPNATATPISVSFYKSGVSTADCVLTDSIAAYSSWIKYMGAITGACNGSGALADGFNGYAVVTVDPSSTNTILGIFNFDSGVGQAGSANMARSEEAATTLYLPQVVRDAFSGHYQSGWQIVNTSANPLVVTVTYTRDNGTAWSHDANLGANAALSVYVGSATVAGADYATNLGTGWNGGASIVVKSGVGTLVGQANIVAGGTGDTLSVYNAFTP